VSRLRRVIDGLTTAVTLAAGIAVIWLVGTRLGLLANGREANLSQVLRLSADRQELVIDEVLTSDLATYKATRVYRRQ
jgi:hypothetical protein